MTENEKKKHVYTYRTPFKRMSQKFLANGRFYNVFKVPKVYAQDSQDQSLETQTGEEESNNSDPLAKPEGAVLNQSRENIVNSVNIGKYVSESEVQDYIKNETGKERLVKFFSEDDENNYSPSLNLIKILVQESAALSFIYFSYKSGKNYTKDFKRENRGTLYFSKFAALRRYNDTTLIQSMKYGAIWAVRVGFFTGAFLGTSQAVSVYRNKTSPIDYGIGGALTGALFKINMGFRGMFAGATILGSFGLIVGTVVWGFLKFFNYTQEDRHYFDVQLNLYKEKENRGIVKPLPPLQTTKIHS